MDSNLTITLLSLAYLFPLSDNLSIQNYQIIITNLRPCLICESYNQAFLYYYMLKKNTLAHLRYSFGGHRPNQTNFQKLSSFKN